MNRARSFFYVCLGILALAAAYHLGARNATAQGVVAPEVAVRSGTLGAGEYIPLPTYKDGTVASVTECQWIISPSHYKMPGSFGSFTALDCITSWNSVDGVQVYSLQPDDLSDRSRANYLIVAVRSTGPTPALEKSWGQVKVDHR
jgi:hypothetical protein